MSPPPQLSALKSASTDDAFHLIPASVNRAGGRSTAPAVSTDPSSSRPPRDEENTSVWCSLDFSAAAERVKVEVVLETRGPPPGFASTPGWSSALIGGRQPQGWKMLLTISLHKEGRAQTSAPLMRRK